MLHMNKEAFDRADAISVSGSLGEFGKRAMATIGRGEISIVILATALILSCFAILTSLGISRYLILSGLLGSQFYLTVLFMVLLAEYSFLLFKSRPDSPIDFFKQLERDRGFFSRLLGPLFLIGSVAFFMPAFSGIKSSIPLLTEYTWDSTFIAWDRAIHGDDPWRILQPILGEPIVTAALGHLYHVWFALIYVGPVCFAIYVKDKKLKTQFFLCYLLTWVLVGMVGAVSLASVGPVFLEPLLGDPYFSEQTDYLLAANAVHTVPVVEVQQLLLEWYGRGEFGLGRGITAMPSMHVALCALYIFATWPIDRRLGIAFSVFALIIAIGSVHLAYHYAVDGYVSFVLVALIWFASRPLVNLIHRDRRGTNDSQSNGELVAHA